MFIRVSSIVYLLFYLYLAFSPEILPHYGIWEWIDVSVILTAITSMFAYSFRIKILNRQFWEYYFYLYIIFELVYMTWLQYPIVKKLNLESYVAANNFFNITTK